MSDVKCAHKDCEESGRWLPVLLIRPSTFRGASVPPSMLSRGPVGMPLCDVHKGEATADEFCSPETFARITEGFTSKGLVAPDPDVGLDFDPLPTCGMDKSSCSNPAVVQVLWTSSVPGQKGASITVCADHLPDVRRILIENQPIEGLDRQEFVLVPQELWR